LGIIARDHPVVHDVHPGIQSDHPIRNKTRETAYLASRGAETAWCGYEKAEFGVLDEDTTHLKGKHN
jgi:hypothetical protein